MPGEGPGGILHIPYVVVVDGSKFADHQGRDRRLDALEAHHLLFNAILVDLEIVGLQIGDELPSLLKKHAYADAYFRKIGADGVVIKSRRVLELGSCRRGRRCIFGSFLFLGDRNGSVVAAGAARSGRSLVGGWGGWGRGLLRLRWSLGRSLGLSLYQGRTCKCGERNRQQQKLHSRIRRIRNADR